MRADLLAPMPEIGILTVLRDKDGVVVRAVGSGSRRCPDCGTLSASCQGRYVRRLQDLSVQGLAVRVEVQVTRWRCRNPQCAGQSFVERLETSALPQATRTFRASELARLLGHVTGGRPAERLLHGLGIRQSDDTVVRIVKRGAVTDVLNQRFHLGSRFPAQIIGP